MRTLAVGDIHGCLEALETLISVVVPASNDGIVFLGDYINRGPDSRGVIDFLMGLSRRTNCIFLRGNHEVMTLEARAERTKAAASNVVGGGDALRSYGYKGVGNWWDFIPSAHWHFIENTQRYFETETHIFVHGCLAHDLDLPEQPDWIIYWERFESIAAHRSGKKVIVGHTPTRDCRIQDVGYAACIDTGCVIGGWLTCLDVQSGEYWQANQKGATNSGRCSEGS